MLEEYLGVPHVRCVSSCTAALFLGLLCLGVGPGDEVLVPAMTFVASANAVEHVGATPVLVDSDPGTGAMDLDLAEALIGPRTKAIMPVHLAGRPIDLDRLNEMRDRHGLLVIEDAAHAIGAEWRGRKVGSFGNLAAYSFYATKNITTAEGGALVADDPRIAERVEHLALHGLSLGAWQRFSDAGYKHYDASEPGFKFNMTDLQRGARHTPAAATRPGASNTARSSGHGMTGCSSSCRSRRRRRQATRCGTHATCTRFSSAPNPPLNVTSCCRLMTSSKIGVGVHYRAVHLHPYYRDKYGLGPGGLSRRDRHLEPHVVSSARNQRHARRPG